MPPSLRRRAHPSPPSPQEALSESDDDFAGQGAVEEEEEVMPEEMAGLDPDEEEDEEDEEPLASPDPSSTMANNLPPPGFREISTLASWTVSSSKPGCSIPQLRHPSTSLFWQSDGPQPHYLNIHFFKLVRIVGLRLFLDFEADESYTPTRIVLLAGSGMNDLVEWGEMRLESPRGWVWADFSGVGEPESDSSDDDEDGDEAIRRSDETRPQGLGIHDPLRDDASDFENAAPGHPMAPPPSTATAADTDPMLLDHQRIAIGTPQQIAHAATPTLPRPHPRHPFATLSANTTPQPRADGEKKQKMPVLRCHLVQIKILENHQNGKDTHLRGLQIFSKDDEKEAAPKRKMMTISHNTAAGGDRKASTRGGQEKRKLRGLTKSEWMAEPTVR